MHSEELQRPVGDLPLRDPVCVPATATVRDAVHRLQALRAGCVMVTDDDARLIGIFTERDVLRKLAHLGNKAGDLLIRDVMTARPTALHVGDSIVYALHQMHVGGHRHVPIVDDSGTPIKLASVRNFVDFLAERLDRDAQRE